MSLAVLTGIIMGYIVLTSIYPLILEKQKIAYFIVTSIIIAIVISIRSTAFPDTLNYFEMYYNGENYVSNEILDTLLISICRLIDPQNPRLYLFLCVVINIIISTIALRKINEILMGGKKNIYGSIILVSLATYFSYFGFLYNAVVVREGLALSFVLLMISKLLDKKYFQGLIILALAIGFHTSAIAALPILLIYLMPELKKNFYYGWLLIVSIIQLSNFSTTFLKTFTEVCTWLSNYIPNMNRMMYYLVTVVSTRSDGARSLKNIYFLIIGCLLIAFSKSENKDYFRLLNIYMVGLTLMSLLNSFILGYRLYDIYLISSVPLLVYLFVGKMKVFTGFVSNSLMLLVINLCGPIFVYRYLLPVMVR